MRKRRWGETAQQTTGKLHIRPYLERVRNLMRHSPESIETALRAVHTALSDYTKSPDIGRNGAWVHRWSVLAAAEMQKVLENTTPQECAYTVAACYLLKEYEPWRFSSERAFRFALVRMWHRQTSVAFGSYWHHERGLLRTYRDLPPRVVVAIAAVLVEAYVPFVARVGLLYKNWLCRGVAVKKALDDGFTTLANLNDGRFNTLDNTLDRRKSKSPEWCAKISASMTRAYAEGRRQKAGVAVKKTTPTNRIDPPQGDS